MVQYGDGQIMEKVISVCNSLVVGMTFDFIGKAMRDLVMQQDLAKPNLLHQIKQSLCWMVSWVLAY